MPTKTIEFTKAPKPISINRLKEWKIPVVPAMAKVFRDFARTITKKDEFCAGAMLMQGTLVDNGQVPIAPCAMGHLALQLHDVDFLVKKLHFTVDKITLESDGTQYYSFRDVDDTEVVASLTEYLKKLSPQLKEQLLGKKTEYGYGPYGYTEEEFFERLANNISGIITGLNDSYKPKTLEWQEAEDFEYFDRPNINNAPSYSRAQYVKECFKLTADAIQAECTKAKNKLGKKAQGRRTRKLSLSH